MFGVLINVGSSSTDPNGRGRRFGDNTFDYLPIPEKKKTIQKVPTYRDLGFAHVRFPDISVHMDPEFKTYTYGHVRRGFGDIQALARLKNSDVLFFYATLQNNGDWSPCIIGYFINLEVRDCRKLSKREIMSLNISSFGNNAHLKRADPSVDFLVRGGKGSRLLEKAFPLAEDQDPPRIRHSLQGLVRTVSSKSIKSGGPWFRWTLICPDGNVLLDYVSKIQKEGY